MSIGDDRFGGTPVTDPKKPWAIVFQRLSGTSPSDSMVDVVRALFVRGAFGGTSIADFWSQQTHDTIDVSTSIVFGWHDSGWSIKTHPGQTQAVERGALAKKARDLVPNIADFRGVIAIYNYQCNASQFGNDVVWGLNAYGSTPAWASDSWRQCDKCGGIIDVGAATYLCAGGGTHLLGTKRYMTVVDNQVPMLRTLAVCRNCAVLYADDVAKARNVAECPGGPAHDPTSESVNVLGGWKDPPADREFSICRLCRCIAHDASSSTCPGRPEGHDPIALAALHFPIADIDVPGLSPRGFLCHEMGHTYGFDHGRGLEPRSHHLDGDCWPGAYGDPYDIMSYGDCQSYVPSPTDPDSGLGAAGPSIAIQQLVGYGLIPAGAIEIVDLNAVALGGPQNVTLRPATNLGVGTSVVWADRFVFEYRRRGEWDRALDSAKPTGVHEPGLVIVRHVAPGQNQLPGFPPSSVSQDELPQLVPSIRGNDFLGSGDTFEARSSNLSASVQIASDGSSAHLTFYPLRALHAQRWLFIPYRASDSSATIDHSRLANIVGGAEKFWANMEGAFSVAASYILSSAEDPNADDPVTVALSQAQLGSMSAHDRAAAVIDAALSVPDPKHPGGTMPMDWRWFTGIALLDGDGKGDGFMGHALFDSGVFPATKDCRTENQPRRLGSLDYAVIELAASSLTNARLAQEIALSLGFARTSNPYDLMADDSVALRYSFDPSAPFGDAKWGPMGPALSTQSLKDHGWLEDWQIQTVATSSGPQPTRVTGSCLLKPVVRDGHRRDGVVRLEVGPYALELRAKSSWDSKLVETVVVAYEEGSDPVALGLGGSVSWGGPIPEIFGGGRVEVAFLSDAMAVLTYMAADRPLIEEGGGTLRGGGTLLFGPDGSIIHIPPGDPFEERARELVGAEMRALVQKVERVRQA